MDFAIQIFARLHITDNITILITDTQVSTWIVMALLLIFAIIVRISSRNWDASKRPSGLQNVMEMAVDAFEKLFRGNAGDKMAFLTPWFFSLFTFLIFSNIIGIVGIRPPTADWGMTFPLAFSSFLMFNYAGLKSRPKAYLKGIFLEPVFIFAPINLMGEIAKPIAMSFRLFGNVLGGMILLSLIYGIAPLALQFVLPAFLHMYFDLAAGLLQAFIFTMLSIAFVGLASGD
ncbi:MAG: F0F1 ATP synthase subunit A [Defluviitaleaceae bacterium]|nr:F0F1 ATP synthase subunit A [Defluviitaleaceae bacterium]